MWNEPPDFEESQNAHRNLARVRGLILRKKREIQKREDELKAEYPRKPELRRMNAELLYDQLVELECLEEEAKLDLEFIQMWGKMWQSLGYRKI